MGGLRNSTKEGRCLTRVLETRKPLSAIGNVGGQSSGDVDGVVGLHQPRTRRIRTCVETTNGVSGPPKCTEMAIDPDDRQTPFRTVRRRLQLPLPVTTMLEISESIQSSKSIRTHPTPRPRSSHLQPHNCMAKNNVFWPTSSSFRCHRADTCRFCKHGHSPNARLIFPPGPPPPSHFFFPASRYRIIPCDIVYQTSHGLQRT